MDNTSTFPENVTVEPIKSPEPEIGIGDALRDIYQAALTPKGQIVTATLVALLFCFGPLWTLTMNEWFAKDSYYSHGPLIPFIFGYIIYSRREDLHKIPWKGVWWAAIPLAGILYVTWIGSRTEQTAVMSILFVLGLLCCTLFLAGWRWLAALTLPVLFLLFGLPIWASVIDAYTNPLQLISTKVAALILSAVGMRPIQLNPTTIGLDRYVLDVAVPCSGLKLLLSLFAFVGFFVLIARLRPWANIVLLAIVLPLAVFINGLRISMIGMVGNTYGEAAGHQFHDYSGYISLVICFLLLGKLTRMLGWK